MIERGKLVVCPQAGAPQTCFSRDSTNFNVADETKHDRTEKPVVCRDANHKRSIVNEVDIDFRIPGLPNYVVKQADNVSRTPVFNPVFSMRVLVPCLQSILTFILPQCCLIHVDTAVWQGDSRRK